MLKKPDITKPGFQLPEFRYSALLTQLDLCSVCSLPIKEGDFKDEISKREYTISGTCQVCQDVIFKGFDDEKGGDDG